MFWRVSWPLDKITLLKNAAQPNYQNMNFQTLSCFLNYLSKIITFSTDIQMILSRTHIKAIDVYYIPVKSHKYWIIFVRSKINTKWTDSWKRQFWQFKLKIQELIHFHSQSCSSWFYYLLHILKVWYQKELDKNSTYTI